MRLRVPPRAQTPLQLSDSTSQSFVLALHGLELGAVVCGFLVARCGRGTRVVWVHDRIGVCVLCGLRIGGAVRGGDGVAVGIGVEEVVGVLEGGGHGWRRGAGAA